MNWVYQTKIVKKKSIKDLKCCNVLTLLALLKTVHIFKQFSQAYNSELSLNSINAFGTSAESKDLFCPPPIDRITFLKVIITISSHQSFPLLNIGISGID
jgi:hypothetical protein